MCYVLTGEDYIGYIDSHDRKSIEYQYIVSKGHLIKEGYNPPLDYLKVIDEIYFEGEI